MLTLRIFIIFMVACALFGFCVGLYLCCIVELYPHKIQLATIESVRPYIFSDNSQGLKVWAKCYISGKRTDLIVTSANEDYLVTHIDAYYDNREVEYGPANIWNTGLYLSGDYKIGYHGLAIYMKWIGKGNMPTIDDLPKYPVVLVVIKAGK